MSRPFQRNDGPECCTRCKLPMLRDDQTCVFHGQRWPCVPPSDQSVFDAPVGDSTLRVKSGWDVNPIPTYDDPYAEES